MDNVILVKERTKMGITLPFICQTEKGKWVVIKTLAMMPISQLLAEFIGSTLANQIGLPCPPISFVNITAETRQYISPQWRESLPIGIAFASHFIPNAKIAKTVQAQNTSYFTEMDQKQLYMFDRWILNADRTASQVGTGNINLLFDEQQQKILVIDHNLAFDKTANFNEHIFAPNNRTWRLDWVDKLTFTEKAIDILANFEHFYQEIPDNWFPVDEIEYQKIENHINEIKKILSSITKEHYWENIE